MFGSFLCYWLSKLHWQKKKTSGIGKHEKQKKSACLFKMLPFALF